jgi:phage tail tape-measure protein
MALKLALILQAVDRLSGPARKAAAGAERLTRGARQLAREGGPAARVMERVSAVAGRMPTWLRAAALRVKQLAGRAGMKGLELAARGAGNVIGTLIGKAARLAGTLAAVGGGVAAYAAGSGIGGVFRLGSSFEQLELRLADVAGGTSAARKELRAMVAMGLPVDIEQLGEAYVGLRKAGIDPTRDALRGLFGEALNNKRGIEEMVAALTEAKNGDFGALESLKIKTTTKGARVFFQYLDKQGKRAVKSARNNSADIERTLTGIFEERSGGTMDRYANSFAGMLVRMRTRWDGWLLKVADAGIFDRAKEAGERLFNWLDKKVADGTMDRWAKAASDWLEKLLLWLEKIDSKDLQGFVTSLSDAGRGVVALADGLGKIYGWLQKIEAMDRAVNNWVDKWAIGGPGYGEAATSLKGKVFGPQPKAAPAAPQRAAPLGVRSASGPASSVKRWIFGASAAPAKVKTSGVVEVRVKAAPGIQASVTGVKKTGDIDLAAMSFRGRAMGVAA